jgi:sugar phosphate permease
MALQTAEPGISIAFGGVVSNPETAIMSKVFRRLLPVLMICYFIAFLDRVNVGFAATMLNRDLGFSASVYGFGAGIFFISYFLFEVPSNLALHKFGARRWIARIMITWGLISAFPGPRRGSWALIRSMPSASCWAPPRLGFSRAWFTI